MTKFATAIVGTVASVAALMALYRIDAEAFAVAVNVITVLAGG